jgi:hypothetical protein
MKQTAVEWLVQEISFLKDMNFDFGDGLPKDIINQAKEMEKEQMIEFAKDCLHKDDCFFIVEQYYNETYKKDGTAN